MIIERNNAIKLKARYLADKAIRDGLLVRPEECEDCKKPSQRPLCAHHEDYSKPLDVAFLCAKCHGRRHRGFIIPEWKSSRSASQISMIRLTKTQRRIAVEKGIIAAVAKETGKTRGSVSRTFHGRISVRPNQSIVAAINQFILSSRTSAGRPSRGELEQQSA